MNQLTRQPIQNIPQAAKVPEVQNMLGVLDLNAENLSKAIATLEGRLEPVCRPRPVPTPDEQPFPVRGAQSDGELVPLAMSIRSISARLQALVDVVEDMARRVEV